jgi:hypothetical protein
VPAQAVQLRAARARASTTPAHALQTRAPASTLAARRAAPGTARAPACSRDTPSAAGPHGALVASRSRCDRAARGVPQQAGRPGGRQLLWRVRPATHATHARRPRATHDAGGHAAAPVHASLNNRPPACHPRRPPQHSPTQTARACHTPDPSLIVLCCGVSCQPGRQAGRQVLRRLQPAARTHARQPRPRAGVQVPPAGVVAAAVPPAGGQGRRRTA